MRFEVFTALKNSYRYCCVLGYCEVSEENTGSIFRVQVHKMKGICYSEMLVPTYQTTRRYKPEDRNIHFTEIILFTEIMRTMCLFVGLFKNLHISSQTQNRFHTAVNRVEPKNGAVVGWGKGSQLLIIIKNSRSKYNSPTKRKRGNHAHLCVLCELKTSV
jgi:hypothetical protein